MRLRELVESFAGYRSTGRLADFGAGDGHLLDAALAAGWTTVGVEYSAAQRQRLSHRGHLVAAPELDDVELGQGSCDVVVLQEVIEHLRDPTEQLAGIARLLRAGGLLYITCPNFNSMSRHLLGPRWRVIEYPEHLNYFTAPSLSRLTQRFGFEVRAIVTTGLSPRDVRRALRPSAVPIPSLESADERIRMVAAEQRTARQLVQGANAVLSLLRLGDTIKARYEKTSA